MVSGKFPDVQHFHGIMISCWLASWRCYSLWPWIPLSPPPHPISETYNLQQNSRLTCQLWCLKQVGGFTHCIPCSQRTANGFPELGGLWSVFLREPLLLLQQGCSSSSVRLTIKEEKLHQALSHLVLADWLHGILNSFFWEAGKVTVPFQKTSQEPAGWPIKYGTGRRDSSVPHQ